MSGKNVIIAKIGERIETIEELNKNKVFDDKFYFEKYHYQLLLDVDISKVIKDVRNVPAFKLQSFIKDENQSLWLTFKPALLQQHSRSGAYLRSTHSIVETFFIIERDFLFNEADEEPEQNERPVEANVMTHNDETDDHFDFDFDDDDDDDSDDADILPSSIIDDLYQQLREAHYGSDKLTNYTNEYVQHINLRPKLTPYQMNGVKWMINRENITDCFPTEFREVKRRWIDECGHIDDEVFFYNLRTFLLKIGENEDIAIPTGGILADAMGLGKTVEMLDLILLNKRVPEKHIDKTDELKYESKLENSDEQVAEEEKEEKVLRCLCLKKTLRNTVACIRCLTLQHRPCVSQGNKLVAPDDQYICPNCWPNEMPILAKTTFIVSPPSIKLQWRDEVIKHINDPNFKVLVYMGLKNASWINPMELASYDIILTDYATLQSEFYYTNHNPTTRQLRRPARYISVKSPLLYVNWWRVCLDEAQMVSSVITKPAKLVAQLSAVHRWAVTGTPIQRSIDDLYGLICFLGCSPYNEREKWSALVDDFNYRGNIKPLLAALCPIMWRTCKSKDVIEQINIPEQTHLVVNIDMMDLERFNYNIEHTKCLDAFCTKTRKMSNKRKLAAMNPHILKIILEPLRKLRQDCTISTILEKNIGITKRTLKPDELLNHLMTTNENDARHELRTVASSLNGIAALHMIKGQTAEATAMYKSVLKWAKDYHERISVDSLLQIHAIHNLLSIDPTITEDERAKYQTELNKFELKYLSKNVTMVQNLLTEQEKWSNRIEEIETQFKANAYQWWIDALECERMNPGQLLRKIQEDVFNSYSFIDASFQSTQGLSMVLTLWLDKVFEERENVQKQFQKLRFYIDNFKPTAEMQHNDREKMLTFLNQAYECHLNLTETKPTAKKNKRKKISECKLCLAKRQLEAYECVIFDKKLIENSDELETIIRGTWKPSYQECILKTILSNIRFADDKEDGKTLMQYLDGLKSEFKEYSQLWVEVNYTVSAYDEIKMCKSRTQAVDPTELEDESELESNLIISKYEVDEQMVTLKLQMQEAELSFVRKLGQLKYLNHLRKNKEIENCPICSTQPKIKYIVLECGHHICYNCCQSWLNTVKGNVFNCFICRHQQSKRNLFHVTMANEKRFTDSSSKIEIIIQKIIELKRDEPNVKIVIFSQWSNILTFIEMALVSAEISYRSKLEKFHQTIQEFKNPDLNVTCLLLPLSYGSKGLNLIEATHVFLVEPILDPGEELQAIGRVHRIGQTRRTYVHRFIMNNTIEEAIYKTVSNDKNGFWSSKKCTIENLLDLFKSTKCVPVE